MYFFNCAYIFGVLALMFYIHSKIFYNDYWKSRIIPFIPPKFPWGTLDKLHGPVLFCKFIQNYYNKFKGIAKYFGTFIYLRPAIVITDLHLAEKMLTTDFSYFNERWLYHNERNDPLSGQLVLLPGEKAKRVRGYISPAFSPFRMKDMFANIISVSERLKNHLRDTLSNANEIDIDELLQRYTIDVIGAAAFGIECNSLEDPENEFKKMCEIGLKKPRHGWKFQFLLNINQHWGRFFGIKLIRDEVSEFFTNIVKNTIEQRESNNIQKKDFLDVLIDIRRGSEDNLSMSELAAQAFAFFTPGFDTISTAMTFMFYEIAKNPEVQIKARREIETILGDDNNNMTYENISKMEYVNQIISGK